MSAAPVYRPAHPTRSRVTVAPPRRKSRASLGSVVLAQAIVFTAIATVTFSFSTLLGFSMKESARREAIRAGERAKAARADVSRIRRRVEQLTTMRAVDEWSRFNGFVTNYQFAQNSARPVVKPRPSVVARQDRGPKVDVLVARIEHGSDVR